MRTAGQNRLLSSARRRGAIRCALPAALFCLSLPGTPVTAQSGGNRQGVPTAKAGTAAGPAAATSTSDGNTTTPATPITFEVATVKPAAPGQGGHTHINYPPGGGFSAQNITIAALMQWAWELPEKQILDGPPWMASTAFDLQAKTDGSTDAALRAMPQEQSSQAKRALVQALLAERFGMKLHLETRTLNAYDLVVVRGGSLLQPSTSSSGKSIGGGRSHLTVQGLDMEGIVQQLSRQADRVVVDRTGLTGRYDFKLQWTPDDAAAGDSPFPPLFTAIQEQLGLKLVPAKEPLRVVVIDAVHLPSEN